MNKWKGTAVSRDSVAESSLSLRGKEYCAFIGHRLGIALFRHVHGYDGMIMQGKHYGAGDPGYRKLDPAPSHFHARHGCRVNIRYMDSPHARSGKLIRNRPGTTGGWNSRAQGTRAIPHHQSHAR